MKKLYWLLTSVLVVLILLLVPLFAKRVLMSDRTVDLRGSISMLESMLVVSQIDIFNEESDDAIFIIISNNGGDYIASVIITDAIRQSEAPIICLVTGEAYSAAALILSTCDERYAFPLSEFLIHNIRLSMRDTLVKDAEDFINENIQNQIDMIDLLVENLPKLTREEIIEIANEDQFFGVHKAMEYGLIDGLITSVKCKKHKICRELEY